MKKLVWIILICMACAMLLFGCGGKSGAVENLLPEPAGSGTSGDEADPAQENNRINLDGVNLPDGDISAPDENAGTSGQTGAPATYKLVIPEGFTLPKIGMRLEELGVCTVQEFIDATQNGDYSSFSLIAGQDDNENRCYNLEGYLFPATYDFNENQTPDDIIKNLLGQMEVRINDSLRSEIAQSGFTIDQIITLASIIEKEAKGTEQMANISSVFHNRLAVGMQLQSDVTISYVVNVIDPFVPDGGETYKYYYNTYRCAALPAGPVCNPGMDAILAAVRPANTDYLYFLTDADDNFYFTADYDEHEANRAKYLGG